MSVKLRNLEVMGSSMLGPHMKRITLGGEALSDFPEDQESGYVKVLFEKDPGSSNPKDNFLMRSYTIRSFRANSKELDLDFLLHGDTGPASRWATGAKTGDRISVAGPGPKKLADEDADWYLFVGDLTSLPAISVNLEQLDRAAKGFALLEVISRDDEIQIDAPDNIEIQWILNPDPLEGSNELLQSLRAIPWLEGEPYVWIAGEFEIMREGRKFVRKEKRVDKKSSYISSYWKIGETDEGMKIAKALDASENE